MTEYVYTDPYSYDLTIRPSTAAKGDVAIEAGVPVDVPVADLPTIVAEMYKAAGQPNPLADRPGQHVMQDIVDRRDLLIEPSIRAEGAVYFGQSSARGWHIRTEDLPELIGALYEAAGKPSPIILDRPAEEDLRGNGWLDGKHVSAIEHELGSITPHAARTIAACLAAAADIAEAEPDPEQVKQLAELIDPFRSAEATARVILSAGYTRSES